MKPLRSLSAVTDGYCDIRHRLADEEVGPRLALVRRALRPGSRFVAIDPRFRESQSLIARGVLALDRGRHIRYAREYESLLRQRFTEVRGFTRGDWLRIPYDFAIFECERAAHGEARHEPR